MLHGITIKYSDTNRSGIPRLDALAQQRETQNPAIRDASCCECCGHSAKQSDLWRAEWCYACTPNKLIGFLAPVAAVAGAAIVQCSREVRHNTYHIICTACASCAKRNRIIGTMLSFVGLFVSLLGLGVSLAAVSWWAMASNAHDRAIAQSWIPPALAALVFGIIVVQLAKRFSVPAAIRPLLKYPFYSTAFKPFGIFSAG